MAKHQRDIKIAVVVITDEGIDFAGIYSELEDAQTIALKNADRGEVLLARWEQTYGKGIPKDRGVYSSNPSILIVPFQAQGLLQ